MSTILLPSKPNLQQTLRYLSLSNSFEDIEVLLSFVNEGWFSISFPVFSYVADINSQVKVIEHTNAGAEVFDLDIEKGVKVPYFLGENATSKNISLVKLEGEYLEAFKCKKFTVKGSEYYSLIPIDSDKGLSEENNKSRIYSYINQQISQAKLMKASISKKGLIKDFEKIFEYQFEIGELYIAFTAITFKSDELRAFVHKTKFLDENLDIEPMSFLNEEPLYKDKNSPYYSKELDIAVKAHKAIFVEKVGNQRQSLTTRIKTWLENNYPDESGAFYERISIVVNPKK